MSQGNNGLSRGDRNRNARLAALRAAVPRDHAVLGIDLAQSRQAAVLADHDSRVIARWRPRLKIFTGNVPCRIVTAPACYTARSAAAIRQLSGEAGRHTTADTATRASSAGPDFCVRSTMTALSISTIPGT